mgnify:CR=1 FL=1
MDKTELSKQYKSFLASPLGKDMRTKLTDRRSQLLAEAESAPSTEQTALLNRAYGVRLAIEHLDYLAFVPKDIPGDKGGKEK